MDILHELKSCTEQAEVMRLEDETLVVEFSANQLKSSQVTETSGTAVRVVRNGQLGFAASTDDRSLDRLVANALESASYGEAINIQFPVKKSAPDVASFDDQIAGLPVQRMVEIGNEVLEILLPVVDDLKVNIELRRSVRSAHLQNQAGAEFESRLSPFSLGVDLTQVSGDDILMLYEMASFTLWDPDALQIAPRLAEKLRRAQKITSLVPGKMPVVFSPAAALTLALPLMDGLNGKNEYQGVSPLKGKVGELLFDRKLTVIDDGTLSGKAGSSSYDDEGIPRRRNVLIKDGTLQGFIYDLKTAAQSETEPTGNGARQLFTPPAPAETNWMIGPGATPLSEMIAGIQEGILLENLLGMGQGNTLSGAFSNPINLAFKIEQGEITGRVKDISIAGNIYELLKDITAISQETEWVYGTLCLPYILLDGMSVAGK